MSGAASRAAKLRLPAAMVALLRGIGGPVQGLGAAVRPFAVGLRDALELEAERGALFLTVPVLLGVGAILYFTFPFEPDWPAVAGALALCACLPAAATVRSNHGVALATGALTLVALGFAAGKAETSRVATKVLGQAVTTRVSGEVVRVEHLPSGRGRILLDVTGTERPQLRYAPERVRLSGKLPPGLRSGMQVSGLARLQPPSGPVMPGGYDFSFRSYFSGIGANGFLLGQPAITSEGGGGLASWIEGGREAVAARIRAAIGGAEGEIAAALIVGVRAGIPEPVNEALRRTGLSHILSISGVHMALVAATIMGGMRALLAALPGFSARRAVKKAAAVTALLAVSAYLLFSGADVAAVRSYLMIAVMLTAVLFDQAALTMRNLAIAAIVILLWSPHEILGPSFQMSFAATAALIAAYGAWTGSRAPGTRTAAPSLGASLAVKALKAIGGLAATSVIAGAATAAFSIYHFQQTAWLGLPANLLAMPIISIVVMPAAVLAMLTMPFGAAPLFLAAMGAGLSAVTVLADWLSRLSPADAVGAIPATTAALTAAAIALASIATTWLRAAAVLPLVAAIALPAFHTRPDVLISEDARMVAVRSDAGIAVNISRGGGFTLENWQRALGSDARLARTSAPGDADTEQALSAAKWFRCESGRCLIETRKRFRVTHAASSRAGEEACRSGDLLIVAAPRFGRTCLNGKRPAVVVDAGDLARRGAAAIRFAEGGSLRGAATVYAIPQPYRPWHEHRRFSRAARGLPEPERKPRAAKRPLPAAQPVDSHPQER